MRLGANANVDVSVLVPVLNEARSIVEVVGAMSAQRLDGNIELLFADGGSTDGTRQQLEQLARADDRIRVLENPRRGVASGLNVCLAAARGRFIARMDGHALYPPDYLQRGIERLNADAGAATAEGGAVAWVAGPQVPEPRGRIGAAVAAALGTRLGHGGSRRFARATGAAAAAGEYELDTGVFCGVWRREDVLAKGGWDERWWVNEDSELAARFLTAGQRIVCLPAMAARYFPRDSLPALWRQYRVYGCYRAKTARRHPASLRRSALLPPLLVITAGSSVLAPRRPRRLARAALGAYAAALLAAGAEAIRHADGRARADGAGLNGGQGVGMPAGELALVPLALATMHAAHGVGFLEGCARWGVPWRALLRALGAKAGEQPPPVDVHAPSLREQAG